MKPLDTVEEKKVLCYFCHKPIYITHLGLIYSDGNIKAFVCDNFCCVVEADRAMNGERNLSHPSDKLKDILEHNKDDMTGLYDYDGIAQEVIDLVKK